MTISSVASLSASPAPRAGVLLAVVAGNLVGNLSLYVVPLLGGVICRRFHIADDMFGYLISMELAGMAVSPILLASLAAFATRPPRAAIAISGVLCILIGNAGMALIWSVPSLFALRLIAGLGEGMVLAVTYRVVVQAALGSRGFSIIQITNGFCLMAIYFAVPPLAGRFGDRGVFLAMAATVLALGPSILTFRGADRAPLKPGPSQRSGRGFSAPVLAFLLGWAVFQVSQNGMWAYVERIGTRAGFTLDDIGMGAVLSAVAYTAAPFLALLLGRKFGWLIPLAAACVLTGVCCVGMPYAVSLWVYLSEFVVFSFAMNLAMPYANAFAAELDPSGRVVTAMPGFFAAGSVAGPAVSGAVFSLFGSYELVGWIVGLTTMPAAGLMGYATFRARPQKVAN
jgi:MFS family permease